MTIVELIKELKCLGIHFDGQTQDSLGNNTLDFSKGKMEFHVDKNLGLNTPSGGMTLCDQYLLYKTLFRFAITPMSERESNPKYRVRLRGFNSENGHQYLTANKENVKTAKFFACAERTDLKQEFTQEELNDIANRDRFKGVGWFQDLIRHAESVEDD